MPTRDLLIITVTAASCSGTPTGYRTGRISCSRCLDNVISHFCKITLGLPVLYCLPERNRENRRGDKRSMASKIFLSSATVQLVVLSLLCDATPASAAAVVGGSAPTRHRRQLPETADRPALNAVQPDNPRRSVLIRAWLDAAAANRQRPLEEDTDVEDSLKQRKRQLSDDDIYFVRRRKSWNGDHDYDFSRRSSVSSTDWSNFFTDAVDGVRRCQWERYLSLIAAVY